jgi:hypothetical protein
VDVVDVDGAVFKEDQMKFSRLAPLGVALCRGELDLRERGDIINPILSSGTGVSASTPLLLARVCDLGTKTRGMAPSGCMRPRNASQFIHPCLDKAKR